MARRRDLWIILRARDEASRVFRSFASNAGNSARGAAANVNRFDRAMQSTAMRLSQFAMAAQLSGAAMVALGAAGLGFIKSSIDVAAEYDRQARRTLTQVDDLSIKLEDVAQVGRNVARDIGVPFETLQETLFFVFSSMDVNITEAEQLLRGFAKEAVAGQTDIESAARTTIAVMNALQIPVSDLTKLQDTQFQIVRKGIISYEELSKTIGRSLPATARAGQTFETLGAMIAFMTRNGLSAAMASTSAARAMEAFAHPVTVARIEDMGIKVRDAKGEFLPLVDVLRELTGEMREMGTVERSKFMEELFKGSGGRIQARRFFDLAFTNFEQFEDMIGHMGNSAGAFDNAYETMAGSVAAQTELMRNKWMLIKEGLGRALLPTFVQFLGILSKVLDWFEQLPQPVKNIIAQFILWGSIISIVIGAILLIIGTLAFFAAGIMLAGKALIIIGAVLGVLIGGLVALAAAFVVAWQKSERFRELIGQVGDFLKELWGIALDTGKQIAAAFNEHVMPALRELWQYIESNIMPVVLELWSSFKEKMLPVVKELADQLIGGLQDAFDRIGDAIQNHLIPALKTVVEWYEANKEGVDQMIGGLVLIAKFIGGVLVVAIATAIAMFSGIIIVISKVIITIFKIIDVLGSVVAFIRRLPETLQSIWFSIVSAIVTAWNAVVQFFKGIWNAIVSGVTTALNFLKELFSSWGQSINSGIWQPFWNTFGGIIKAAWDLILAVIRFFTVLISEIIKDWINPIIETVKTGWNSVWSFLKNLWNTIAGFFGDVLNSMRNIWSTVWESVKSKASSIWNAIKGVVSSAINAVKSRVGGVMDSVKSIWNSAWNAVKSKVSGTWNSIIGLVKDKIAAVKGLFSGSGGWLVQAGKDIIQGLLNGIESMIGKVTEKLNKLTSLIPENKGPKVVDLRLLRPAGQDIIRGLVRGIEDQMPTVMRKLQGLTAEISHVQPTIPIPTGARAASVPQQPQTINQNITINTNEIDPRFHSVQLGWLMQTQARS